MTGYIILRNNTSGKQLKLRLVDNFDRDYSQNVADLDFAEGSPNEVYLMAFSGQKANITLISVLFDSSADLTLWGGGGGDSILTKEQQETYLVGSDGDTSSALWRPNSGDQHQLIIDSNGDGVANRTYPCRINRIRFNEVADRPLEIRATFDLMIGSPV
jgi:hypothetical protein